MAYNRLHAGVAGLNAKPKWSTLLSRPTYNHRITTRAIITTNS